MTAKGIYEATLIELSKVNAPALKLHEFNYLCNKAINQFINEIYNSYDINQQTTDDIRVLKSTAYLQPKKVELSYPTVEGAAIKKNTLTGATYEIQMPQDYLHLLNCICVYYLDSNYKCYDKGDYIEIPAKRLTADSWSNVVNDIYNKPSPLNPYYYIHNRNQQIDLPTNPIHLTSVSEMESKKVVQGTDVPSSGFDGTKNDLADANTAGSNFVRTIKLTPIKNEGVSSQVSVVDKPTGLRYSNPTSVRCEIRYGMDDSIYKLVEVQVEYLKSPQFIRLTQEQIDRTADTSQIIEFPDYICQEIINKLVTLLMERAQDPRLATNVQINHTIARPTEQQQQQTTNQA